MPEPRPCDCGAGADGGCDPAHAPRLPGLGDGHRTSGRASPEAPSGASGRSCGHGFARDGARLAHGRVDTSAHGRCASGPVTAVRQPLGTSGAWGGRASARGVCGSLSEGRERIPHPTATREREEKRSSPATVAKCAPPRGPDPACARQPFGRPCPERRLCMRSAARDRQRSRSPKGKCCYSHLDFWQ